MGVQLIEDQTEKQELRKKDGRWTNSRFDVNKTMVVSDKQKICRFDERD